MENDFIQKQVELEKVEEEIELVKQDVSKFYDLLMRKFWNHYPMLRYDSEVIFSDSFFDDWITHQKLRREAHE